MATNEPSSSMSTPPPPPSAAQHAAAAEPILRYDRLGGGVKQLLAETTATALALSSKLIAVGTSDGAVSVHDYEGNQIKHYPLHQGPVLCLSFDASAEYLASCCSPPLPPPPDPSGASANPAQQQPHYAAVTSLYADETTKLAFKRPLRCLALDPLYASRKSREVATADARGRLKITSAGWLGRSDRALPCESPVSALQWVGRTLAWASDAGVRVYDSRAGQVLGGVARPRTTAAARTTRPATATTTAGRRPGATAPTPSSLPTPSSSVAPSAPGSPRPGTAASASASSAAGGASASAAAAALADGSEPLPHAHVRACRLYLAEDERTLYVAWPDAIRVVSISAPGDAAAAGGDALPRRVSVVASFPTTGFYCLGAVPHGKDKLAVLALPEGGGDGENDGDDDEGEDEDEADDDEEEEAKREGRPGLQQQQLPRTAAKPFGSRRVSSTAAAAAPALVRSPGGSGSGYLERYIQARGTGSDALAAAAAALQSAVSGGVVGGGGGVGGGPSASGLGLGSSGSSSGKSRLAAAAGSAAGGGGKEGEEEQQEEDKGRAGRKSAPQPRRLRPRQQPKNPSSPSSSPSAAASRRPELRILARDGGSQFASDALAVRGFAACGPADYALCPSYGNELALAGALAAAAAAAAATAEAFASTSASSSSAATASGTAGGAAATHADTTTATAATAAALARLSRLQEESGAGAGGEFMYFILSPRDVVYGRFRDAEDRVAWLMERGRFADALALAAAAGPSAVPPGVRDAAAAAFLEDLTSPRRGEWDRAAAALPALLGDRPQLWERWLHTFAAARKLRALAPRVPTRNPPGPLLSRAAYESVLNALLADPDDHPTLLALVQSWPNALYRPAALTDAVAARLRRAAEAAAAAAEATTTTAAGAAAAAPQPSPAATEAAGGTRSLWQTLALLYKAQGRPDLSLAIYLQLRLPSVFDFLQQQQPAAAAVGVGGGAAGGGGAAATASSSTSSSSSSGLLPFLDGPKAAALFEIDERKATDLLVRNMDAVPPAAVVPALLEAAAEAEQQQQRGATADAATPTPTTPQKPTSPRAWRRRAHEYLHRIFLADPSAAADHADLQLDLIAEFSPKERLMPFLQASQRYPLEKALTVCRALKLVDEQVFLLSRMGNPRAALGLIVETQRDVPRAIEFVRSQEQQQRLAAEAAAMAAAAGDESAAAAAPPPPPQQPPLDDDSSPAALWDQLIAWAIAAGGETTGALLDNLGGSLDPLVVVERIPGDLKVPALRDRLARAVADHRSGAGLLEGCATILRADAARLVARLGREARRAARDVYVVVEGGGGVGFGGGGVERAAGRKQQRRDEGGEEEKGARAAAVAAAASTALPRLLLRYDATGMPAGACAPEDLPRGAYKALLSAAAADDAQAAAAGVAASPSPSSPPPAQAGRRAGGSARAPAAAAAARSRLAARGALWVGLTAAAREEDERERRRQRPTAAAAGGGRSGGGAAGLVAQ